MFEPDYVASKEGQINMYDVDVLTGVRIMMSFLWVVT
jgi:hypothetical protein